MCCGNEEHSGIMVKMSRRAGTCVGMVAAAGKKITGVVTNGATAAGHLITRPVHTPEFIATEQTEPMPEEFDMEAEKQWAEQEESGKSLISALESDLAEARNQLKEVQSKAEKTQSQIELQLNKLQSEKEALRAELEKARSQANEATQQVSEVNTQVDELEILETNLTEVEKYNLESSHKEEQHIKTEPPFEMNTAQTEQKTGLPKPVEEVVTGTVKEKINPSTGTAVMDIAEDVSLKIIEEQPSQVVSDIEISGSLDVTDEQIQAAVFSKATDKILFAKAVSDMENQDVVVRLDAVKRIADIGHELSIKILSTQMVSEQSPQVRQECIKALTTLGSKEGLPAIENALADESGLVRLAAVWGLYRLAGKQSGTALASMLSDEDEGVRRRAATCIGWLGQGKFAADLTILLDDDSVSVRQSAAEALGNLGNERVVLSLVEHLKDPDKTTRKTVLSAIETITGKKMGKSLPINEEDINRLIARWRQWWKEDMLK